jgi:hypothetical protein
MFRAISDTHNSRRYSAEQANRGGAPDAYPNHKETNIPAQTDRNFSMGGALPARQ